MPEQRPADMNALFDNQKEFEKAIDETMGKIAEDAYNNRVEKEAYMETLGLAHEHFFNSMKGATNIHREDVEDLVEAETGRQERLYERIKALGVSFEDVNPMNPSGLAAYPHWDHGPSRGCNVTINKTRFYAMPRVPCSTDEYITLKQAPVLANIVYVNRDMILMLPYGENPSDMTRKELNKLLDVSGQITEPEFDTPIRVRKNYLWAHSEKKIEENLIYGLLEKYSVDAFMLGYPGRNLALIYTGLEESIEALWKKMYFDWGNMWRRYGWYE